VTFTTKLRDAISSATENRVHTQFNEPPPVMDVTIRFAGAGSWVKSQRLQFSSEVG
jgi:hypothetical protein